MSVSIEFRRPSVWRHGNPNTSRSVKAASMAISEMYRCPPDFADGIAIQVVPGHRTPNYEFVPGLDGLGFVLWVHLRLLDHQNPLAGPDYDLARRSLGRQTAARQSDAPTPRNARQRRTNVLAEVGWHSPGRW